MDYNTLMGMMRGMRDPKEFLKQYAKTNANAREAIEYLDKCGDPKTAFYQMASAKGVDPEAILSKIRK
jgi:hypothetical protein